MPEIISKIPFLRLLIPLLAGILIQYYWDLSGFFLLLIILAIVAIATSFFIRPDKQFKWRWLFGFGLCLFLMSAGIASTSFRQSQSAYTFPDEKLSYKGVVNNIPQIKAKSIACEVYLEDSDKKIICYLQKGVRSKQVQVGDEIMFMGKIEPFRHFCNPDDFDYPRHMYNKGFAGSIYLFSDDWEASGEKVCSTQILALKCRQQILNFYKSLNLNDTEYSIVSALLLGYTDNLTDDIKQAFRTTGTTHVLSVSGMHVGIIYGVIISIFSLFCSRVRYNRAIQLLIIAFLWIYAFVTGLSPSVIRAAIMLSIFCMANLLGRKGFTYNNIMVAAFLMLVYNPFYFFDLGFQLSFVAVLSICFFQPILSRIIKVDNKYLKPIWNLFTLSFAAQLGTSPICLYYFGTFPTYFFITNLLIAPLVSIIIYISIALFIFGFFSRIMSPEIIGAIYYIPIKLLKFSVSVLVEGIHFFESLPLAQITDIKISLPSAILLILIIVFATIFLTHRKSKAFLYALTFTGMLMAVHTATIVFEKNSLCIYQQQGNTLISHETGRQKIIIDSISNYQLITLNDKTFLSVSSDVWEGKQNKDKPFVIDYLHLVKNDSISLYSLTQTFSIKNIIIDHSLSGKKRNSLIKDCEKLNIPYYDMSEKGIFRIFF